MAGNDNNLWWAIDRVLAGMRMPYVHPLRRMDPGAGLDDYPDDLPLIYGAGIRAVVCLLNIPGDRAVFEAAGFQFLCLPMQDGHPPTIDQARAFNEFVDNCRLRSLPVAAHCHAGIGRTGTMLCCYLIHNGMSAAEAVAHARRHEPSAVETMPQRQFLHDFQSRPRA